MKEAIWVLVVLLLLFGCTPTPQTTQPGYSPQSDEAAGKPSKETGYDD